MKSHILLFFLFHTALVFSQDVKQSLLVCHAEMTPEAQKVFRQKIYAYHFTNGTYTGREELISIDGKKGGHDYVRVDRGKNIIYKDRYLITGIGNIVDLREKKILFDGKAHLVRLRNDSAVYYTNDAFKGKFYSVYNFKTGQYAETKDLLFKARLDKDIEFDKGQHPFRINFYPQGKPKSEVLADAGFGQKNIPEYKYIPDPPLHWITDNDFLYAHFNESGDQVEIRKVNLESSKWTSLGRSAVPPGSTEARFEKQETDLLFVCGSLMTYVDQNKNALINPEQCKAKNGFSYSLKSDAKGRAMLYKGKEIGNFPIDLNNFTPAPGVLAAIKVMFVGEESYQQGLHVWSEVSSTWKKIDSEDIVALLGWLPEK